MIASIHSLPNELLHKAISQLLPRDRLALRLTCYNFKNRIPAEKPAWNMDDLVLIERWYCYNPVGLSTLQVRATEDYFACSSCLKIRAARHFSNAMMKGPRGKRCPDPLKNKANTRKCLDCLTKIQHYPTGLLIEYGGLGGGHGFVCRDCYKFSSCWWDARNSPKPRNWSCADCYVRRSEAARMKRMHREPFDGDVLTDADIKAFIDTALGRPP